MKKLMIAILVLATAFVHAQSAEEARASFHYLDGKFFIDSDGYFQLTYDMPGSKPGQNVNFGYYIFDDAKPLSQDDLNFLDDKPKNHDTITISGLKSNQVIGFYFASDKSAGATILSTVTDVDDEFGKSFVSFSELKPGYYTFGDEHWDGGRVLAFTEVESAPSPAPSGQPLPGALTTMLVAGGCAAFLRKRKAARK